MAKIQIIGEKTDGRRVIDGSKIWRIIEGAWSILFNKTKEKRQEIIKKTRENDRKQDEYRKAIFHKLRLNDLPRPCADPKSYLSSQTILYMTLGIRAQKKKLQNEEVIAFREYGTISETEQFAENLGIKKEIVFQTKKTSLEKKEPIPVGKK